MAQNVPQGVTPSVRETAGNSPVHGLEGLPGRHDVEGTGDERLGHDDGYRRKGHVDAERGEHAAEQPQVTEDEEQADLGDGGGRHYRHLHADLRTRLPQNELRGIQ